MTYTLHHSVFMSRCSSLSGDLYFENPAVAEHSNINETSRGDITGERTVSARAHTHTPVTWDIIMAAAVTNMTHNSPK